MSSSPLSVEFLAGQDCALIVTDHSACDYDLVVRHAPLVVDTRNATRNVKHGREKICKA
jgi:UDP-N-acetyl-D-glucosamine dehydrogenase